MTPRNPRGLRHARKVPAVTEPTLSVETQLALLNQKVDDLLAATKERGLDHEQRIRKLEQFKWVMVGAAFAAGGAAGTVGAAMTKALGG
jgi:hypothetical protein